MCEQLAQSRYHAWRRLRVEPATSRSQFRPLSIKLTASLPLTDDIATSDSIAVALIHSRLACAAVPIRFYRPIVFLLQTSTNFSVESCQNIAARLILTTVIHSFCWTHHGSVSMAPSQSAPGSASQSQKNRYSDLSRYLPEALRRSVSYSSAA